MKRITISEWNQLINKLYEKIKDRKYSGIFGVPRGGIPSAAILAQKMNIPLLEQPEPNCLVHDDLVDSGRTREKYKGYDFEALIVKGEDGWKKDEWLEFWYEDTQQDAEDIIVRQLEFIGENPKREGLLDTPARVTRMWKELYKGYDDTAKPILTTFENGKDGLSCDQIIYDEGYFFSHCEHHTVPFFGRYYFGYIPSAKILGLSKVARVVDYFSARLQVQERLTSQIVDYINADVQAQGMILILEGRHLCKEMRGVKKIEGMMKTSKVVGLFKEKPELEQKFLQMMK